jgi:hypothetical protein
VERETGFEPATSTLASSTSALGGAENPARSRSSNGWSVFDETRAELPTLQSAKGHTHRPSVTRFKIDGVA